jgi:hypothetical protein
MALRQRRKRCISSDSDSSSGTLSLPRPRGKVKRHRAKPSPVPFPNLEHTEFMNSLDLMDVSQSAPCPEWLQQEVEVNDDIVPLSKLGVPLFSRPVTKCRPARPMQPMSKLGLPSWAHRGLSSEDIDWVTNGIELTPRCKASLGSKPDGTHDMAQQPSGIDDAAARGRGQTKDHVDAAVECARSRLAHTLRQGQLPGAAIERIRFRIRGKQTYDQVVPSQPLEQLATRGLPSKRRRRSHLSYEGDFDPDKVVELYDPPVLSRGRESAKRTTSVCYYVACTIAKGTLATESSRSS